MPDNLDPDVLARLVLRKTERPMVQERPARALVENRYAFWLDAMGARNAMRFSLPRAAIHMLKIHVAALEEATAHTPVTVLPVGDGVLALASPDDLGELMSFVDGVMRRLALTFVLEKTNDLRFLVRGGLAYGRAVYGTRLNRTSPTFKRTEADKAHTRTIAIGPAVGDAYETESEAPPFGVALHSSVVGDPALYAARRHGVFYRWFDEATPGDLDLLTGLRARLPEYFAWLRDNHLSLLYDHGRLAAHWERARQYFQIRLTPGGQAGTLADGA